MHVSVEKEKRWTARVTYRTDGGFAILHHAFDEFDELGTFIEGGPHWDSIVDVSVILNNPTHPGLTVEKAASL